MISADGKETACRLDRVTVRQVKAYVKAMAECGNTVRDGIMLAVRLLPELFDGVRHGIILRAKASQVLTAVKTTHFVMQEVALPTFQLLSAGEPIERQKSIFDLYDEENGYTEENDAPWEVCLENIETVTQAAIKLLGMSYSDVMEEPLATLVEHLKWEIEHRKEG